MLKKKRNDKKKSIDLQTGDFISNCFVYRALLCLFFLNLYSWCIYTKYFLKIFSNKDNSVSRNRNIQKEYYWRFFFFQLEKHLRSWIIFRFFYVLLFLKILILIKWKLLYVISIFKTRTFAYLHSKSMFLYAYDRAQWTGLTIHSGPEPTGS